MGQNIIYSGLIAYFFLSSLAFFFPFAGIILLVMSLPLPFSRHILGSSIYPYDVVFTALVAGYF
ncbi:MAG: hypothetical protein ABH885_02945, partial [Candidatus Omnitrophota bacterium]